PPDSPADCCARPAPITASHRLSLHDALPICAGAAEVTAVDVDPWATAAIRLNMCENAVTLNILGSDIIGTEIDGGYIQGNRIFRSEEHTFELQSRENLVCRLLPEKKKRE